MGIAIQWHRIFIIRQLICPISTKHITGRRPVDTGATESSKFLDHHISGNTLNVREGGKHHGPHQVRILLIPVVKLSKSIHHLAKIVAIAHVQRDSNEHEPPRTMVIGRLKTDALIMIVKAHKKIVLQMERRMLCKGIANDSTSDLKQPNAGELGLSGAHLNSSTKQELDDLFSCSSHCCRRWWWHDFGHHEVFMGARRSHRRRDERSRKPGL